MRLTLKSLKIWTHQVITVTDLKMELFELKCSIVSKDEAGITNSMEPDKTVPSVLS